MEFIVSCLILMYYDMTHSKRMSRNNCVKKDHSYENLIFFNDNILFLKMCGKLLAPQRIFKINTNILWCQFTATESNVWSNALINVEFCMLLISCLQLSWNLYSYQFSYSLHCWALLLPSTQTWCKKKE